MPAGGEPPAGDAGKRPEGEPPADGDRPGDAPADGGQPAGGDAPSAPAGQAPEGGADAESSDATTSAEVQDVFYMEDKVNAFSGVTALE